MSIGHNLPAPAEIPYLSLFELPRMFVEPAVRALRMSNTVLDSIFYDVPRLSADLRARDSETLASGGDAPSSIIAFDALSDPEGSLIYIDAARAPYVQRYKDVELFLTSPSPEAQDVAIATITGVGSSALGSAALAWDISVALRKPVLAIVPGYGVADVVLQALGGWFGFGLHDFLQTKSVVQNALASVAPATASIGRELSASAPDAKTVHGGPVFRYGSGSSDVLHALLQHRAAPFGLLIGHSKGALQIGNAIQSLPSDRTLGLRVVTLGCPIAEDVAGVDYHQYLGLFRRAGTAQHVGPLADAMGADMAQHQSRPPPGDGRRGAGQLGEDPHPTLFRERERATAVPIGMERGDLAPSLIAKLVDPSMGHSTTLDQYGSCQRIGCSCALCMILRRLRFSPARRSGSNSSRARSRRMRRAGPIPGCVGKSRFP